MFAKKSDRRLLSISLVVLGLVVSVSISFLAFEDSVSFFVTPSELKDSNYPSSQRIRVGGIVQENSIVFLDDGLVTFSLTDGKYSLPVKFKGKTPDLFEENEEAIIEGYLKSDLFEADNVLARHDENYMPASYNLDI